MNHIFSYQKNNRFFAQVADGLEQLGQNELQELGAKDIKPGYRVLYFNADKPSLYKINYYARIITRVMAPLLTFDCHSDKYLYQTAFKQPWPQLFSPRQTFAVFANVSHSKINHSQYAALKLKDAIVDKFMQELGLRPDIDSSSPDLWIHLHIQNNKATISLDSSGGSLHRRGYRQQSVQAPMQENLAAAMIRYTGWQKDIPVYDPMCGSGTLLAEAFMKINNIPGGYLRPKFGFEHFPDFEASIWKQVQAQAKHNMQQPKPDLIQGSDIDDQAIQAARKNCALLPGGKNIKIQQADFSDTAGLKGGIIVCNPPYGKRLENRQSAHKLLQKFGIFLREKCSGSNAFIYLGDKELHKNLRLSPAWMKNLKNGGLDGYLAKYKIMSSA